MFVVYKTDTSMSKIVFTTARICLFPMALEPSTYISKNLQYALRINGKK